jgi:hypothetical protein
MKEGLPGDTLRRVDRGSELEEARLDVARWIDLSRRKIDVCLLSAGGEIVEEFASPPDADGLRGLTPSCWPPRAGGAWGDRVDDRRAVRP